MSDGVETVATRRGLFGWMRRQKDRVEALAESPRAGWWLFVIAFMESSFFPIPPDVLLLPLAASAPRKSLRFAAICTAGSVIGAILGWVIGYAMYESVGRLILDFYHATDAVDVVLAKYRENAFAAIIVAGFTPIPYKAFTILAGVNATVALPMLLGASVIGRGARFFLLAGIVRLVGPSVKPWVDKYFDVLAIVFTVLLIGGFFVLKVLL
ncbi:MAG: DedA family protein [Candidatus Poribacteria bacterium]|nr:DedA family protein [Candidatus Poribacteria bacterium]